MFTDAKMRPNSFKCLNSLISQQEKKKKLSCIQDFSLKYCPQFPCYHLIYFAFIPVVLDLNQKYQGKYRLDITQGFRILRFLAYKQRETEKLCLPVHSNFQVGKGLILSCQLMRTAFRLRVLLQYFSTITSKFYIFVAF